MSGRIRSLYLVIISEVKQIVEIIVAYHFVNYVVGSKSFRPDQLFKVTEIKQLCYFSAYSPFISTHFSYL